MATAASSRSWLLIAFLIIAVLPLPTKLENADFRQPVNSTEATEWRESILSGISFLEKIDYPGRVVVFGERAEPILTGNIVENVLVAAAEFGKGRIVAISHTSYADKFLANDENAAGALKKFHDNLKKWLTKGTFQNNDSIIDAKDNVTREKLKSVKIVVHHGGQIGIDPEDLTEFVRNGGALLHSEIPHTWKRRTDGMTLSDVPYATLLSEAGLCYGYRSPNETGFSVENNKASEAHLLRVLDESGKNFSRALDQVNMLKGLKYIPANGFLKLKKLVKKLWDITKVGMNNSTLPSPKRVITNKREIAGFDLWLLLHDLLQIRNVKAPGVNFFPGDFETHPPVKSQTLEFHSDKKDFHSTYCYLPAGQTIKVEVLSGNDEKNWQMRIGCHNDDLTGKEKLRRWPKVSKTIKLDQKSLEISTPFGGLIYLISPDKPNDSISVKLENVVDSPKFRLTEGEKGEEKWNQSRNYPGLWADIEGKFIAFTFPASSVKEMEFDALTSVMKIWDSVVLSYHDLRGTDVSKFRRMWIVADVQISGGSMHAGYPIMTHLNVADSENKGFVLNSTAIQTRGRWGIFHEIGHNMQRQEWTFEGTGEVTCNIFALYAMDEICHLKPWIHYFLTLNKAEKFFKDGADFKKWKSSPETALFVYAQVAHEFGWESYKKVFRRYEAMPEKEKPKTDQHKIDKWFSIFSEIVGFNLAPLATFWNIPLSVEADAHLHTAFPVGFLPDDEVTRFAPDRVQAVLRMYPGTVRNRRSASERLHSSADGVIRHTNVFLVTFAVAFNWFAFWTLLQLYRS